MDNEYDEDKDVAGSTVGNSYLEEKEEVVFPLRNWPFMLGMQLFDFDSIISVLFTNYTITVTKIFEELHYPP
jgi:hypothetical protein